MKEKYNNIYHKKILWLSAAKTVLTDNFLYYKSLIDIKAIDKTYETINKSQTLNNKVVLYDKIGVASDNLMRKFMYTNLNSDIFYFIDDEFLNKKIKAIYISNTNFFIFDIRHSTHNTYLIDLNLFYYFPLDRRHNNIDYYLKISDYFLEAD